MWFRAQLENDVIDNPAVDERYVIAEEIGCLAVGAVRKRRCELLSLGLGSSLVYPKTREIHRKTCLREEPARVVVFANIF